MDDEDDSVFARAGLRSPVRDVVEGDTVNPNYHEITAPRPGEPGSIGERISRARNEYQDPPQSPKWLADLRRRLVQPLQSASEHLPPGAMDVLSAVLPGPKAAIRPSARPPLPDIPAPTIRAGRQTVTNPYRDPLFPGIYGNPKEIAAEAAERAVPESENLSKVFPRVSRETLADINMQGTRQGNVDPSSYLALAPNPKGSEAAGKVMNRPNEQRILDIATEAGKYPHLRDMDNWYVMDPLYKRMEQLFGPEEAKQRFRFLQAMMGMASPGSEVTTEIPRGLVAHYLAHQGRFGDFINFGGKTSRMEDATGIAMPGHPYHSTSQAGPMGRFLESGDLASSMKSPKVPNYIYAHGVPETGFQTKNAVPDAHWSRLVGLGDARRGPSDIGASASMSEMQDLWPWWQRQIAQKLGIEPVPAQARVWGAGSGQTGVSSPIGPSKLEMFSDHVAKTAHRLGVSPETARDMILTGTAYRQGGMVHKDEGGSAGDQGTPTDAVAALQGPIGAIKDQYNNSALSDWVSRLYNAFSPTERAIRNADPMGYQGPEVAEEALRRWRNDQIEQGAADRIRRDIIARRPDDEGPSRSAAIEGERGLVGPLKWSDNAGNQQYLYSQLPEGPKSSYGQGVEEDRKVYHPDDIANFRAQYSYDRFGGPDPQYDSGDDIDELRRRRLLRRQQGRAGGGRASDVDPDALARSPGRQLDPNPQQIEPDPNRPEYTGQINDFKEHPYWNVINMLRQIPMSMGYTGAAEGAATMGAIGHILRSVLNRGAKGPAGARFAPTTPASPDRTPVPTSPDRRMISRALGGEKPLRVDLHGTIPDDVDVKAGGGSVVRNDDGSIYSRGKDYAIGSDYAAQQRALDQMDDQERHWQGIAAAIRGYKGPGKRESAYVEDRRNEPVPTVVNVQGYPRILNPTYLDVLRSSGRDPNPAADAEASQTSLWDNLRRNFRNAFGPREIPDEQLLPGPPRDIE